MGANMVWHDERAKYRRGQGPNALGAAKVIIACTLSIQYMNKKLTVLTFDVMDDESPRTIGM